MLQAIRLFDKLYQWLLQQMAMNDPFNARYLIPLSMVPNLFANRFQFTFIDTLNCFDRIFGCSFTGTSRI